MPSSYYSTSGDSHITSAGSVVVVDDVMELEAIELVLELADFQVVGVHVLLVAIPRLVDLIDDHCGVAVDQ
jgi:hypothetical protein